MSICIRTLKNTRKISRDFSRELKQLLEIKPNSRIGLEWKDDLYKVTNNFKKLKKLDWSQTKFFPLAIYAEKQLVPLDKEIKEKFLKQVNFNNLNYENIDMKLEDFISNNNLKNLFTFDTSGGVDLAIFFIDSRGNFAFNDFESRPTFINHANNGSEILSAGIKSLLSAKRIICFALEEKSRNIIKKLNKKIIDEDDVLTYLHFHNNVTLYTTQSIFRKFEVNESQMTQNIIALREKLLKDDEEVNMKKEDTSLGQTPNSSELNLKNNNENMTNLDKELKENIPGIDLSSKQIDYEEEDKEDDVVQNTLFETADDKVEEKEEEVINNEDDIVNESSEVVSEDINIKDSIDLPEIDLDYYSDYSVEKDEKELEYVKPDNLNEIEIELPNDPKAIERYIQIKEETLKQIEAFIMNNKLSKLKNKTQEKHFLIKNRRKMFNDEYVVCDLSKLYELSYIPDNRPTPMLMVWNEKNKESFDNIVSEMNENIKLNEFGEWIDDYTHVWNDGAYIIYDKNNNDVKCITFSSDDRLIFLLRYICKPLVFKFDSNEDYKIWRNITLDKEEELKVEAINEK